MNRREFLTLTGGGIAALTMNSSSLFSGTEDSLSPESGGRLFDEEIFDAAPRIVFTGKDLAYINVLPKRDKSLEIELYIGNADARICNYKAAGPFIIKDSTDMPMRFGFHNSSLQYQLRWRELGVRKWTHGSKNLVKTPFVDLAAGDSLDIILIGDDHTADDADMNGKVLRDKQLRKDRLTGDCVNMFVRKLLKNPDYIPEIGSQESHLMNAWSLASTLAHIAKHEKPHAIINMGDSNPFGFGYKWPGLGLVDHLSATEKQIAHYADMFHRSMRKKFSIVSPTVPVYLAKGNHDAECGYQPYRRAVSVQKRKKYWKQPSWGLHGHEEGYFPLFFGPSQQLLPARGERENDVMLMLLDSESYNLKRPRTVEDFTLGEVQKYDIERVLKESDGVRYKLFFTHRLIGGMPGGPGGDPNGSAYARGPLATREDYRRLNRAFGYSINPENVEQVWLTNLLLKHGVDVLAMGHDHIFKDTIAGKEDKNLNLICAGSSKYRGEIKWWRGDMWRYFYGNYGRYGDIRSAQATDFWGSSGYTKLSINKHGIKVKYIRSAYNHPFTNISPSKSVGEIVYQTRISE